jgi:Gamma-aminobutyrate permease and related permeases
MRAMGELLLSKLSYKSFRDAVADLLGPNAGFITGWTYWFCWIVTGIADVVVIAGYVKYWWSSLPGWIPSLATVLLLLGLNLVAVKMFGEMEFWFAMVKIIAIVALIVIGLVLVTVHFKAPDGTEASWGNFLGQGGFFPNGFSGFLAGFQIAIFAFVGIELVGTAAAETKEPRKTLPKAINSLPLRIVLFYVGALTVIMLVTPWDHVSPEISPFVQMFSLAGFPAAAGIINFVVLTAAASSANSGIFSTSRMIYGLSLEGNAPKVMSKLSDRQVPSRALIFSVSCLLPAIILLYAGSSVMEAFTLATTVSSVLFIVVWSLIVITYMKFVRVRPADHAASIYRMPGSRFMPWILLAFFVSMLVVLALEDDTRAALLATPVWFILLGAVMLVRNARSKKVEA